MWYLMRERGEHARADALRTLYTQRIEPGGPYPDPREPAAFSPRAIVAATAHAAGVTIWPVPYDEHDLPIITNHGHAVWLMTYPPKRDPSVPGGSTTKPPTIALLHLEEELMMWFASCVLGWIALSPGRIHDAAIPPGAMTLPTDPLPVALIHRYAHALLLVDFDCSHAFGCSCASIETRLNAVPPDHPQPTLTMPAATSASSRVTPIISDLTPPTPPPGQQQQTPPLNP
jgi:hypothetical protein